MTQAQTELFLVQDVKYNREDNTWIARGNNNIKGFGSSELEAIDDCERRFNETKTKEAGSKKAQ